MGYLTNGSARHLGLLVAVVNYVWFVATTGPRFVVASVQTAIELWRSSSKTYPPAAILENIRYVSCVARMSQSVSY